MVVNITPTTERAEATQAGPYKTARANPHVPTMVGLHASNIFPKSFPDIFSTFCHVNIHRSNSMITKTIAASNSQKYHATKGSSSRATLDINISPKLNIKPDIMAQHIAV